MSPIALFRTKPGRALAATLALAGLLARVAQAAPTAADRAIADAERRVGTAASARAWVGLASAFMQKARETGDPSYYDRAAAAVERALAVEPSDYGALRARAWVLLGQHRFARALGAARAARRLQPRDWWNYGNLADACVELGRYRDAAHATSRMMALRPGPPAYARAAALRALSGDRHGAIEALELALAAADPVDAEERAWLLTYLGHEHLALGEVERAGARYAAALAAFPDYHLALPGLARVRVLEGRPDEAISLYERALARFPTAQAAGALGDLYARAGNPARARDSYAFAVYMGRIAAVRGQSPGRDLALFLADHDRDLAEALRLARAEAAARDDVYTNDALAWALYKNGRLADAKRAVARALRLGTEDASFHEHAAVIVAALGRDRVAARHRRAAEALAPAVDAARETGMRS